MKKTIAIIELYEHDEVLRHYLHLLQNSPYNIKVFCSKVVYESLEEFILTGHFSWVVKKDLTSISDFLASNYAAFRESDLVFITTALSYFKAFYKLSKRNKTLLLVHNAHSFLVPTKNVWWRFNSPLNLLRILKIYSNRSHAYKRKMLQSLVGLAFPTPTILNYVKHNFKLPLHLQLSSISFACYLEKQKVRHSRLTITVPCTVVSDVRDYLPVLTAFEKISFTFNQELRLILLGQPQKDGHKIIRSFKALATDKLEIVSFDQFIPVTDYEKWLLESDFLILPIKSVGLNHIYKEKMGYSKISGGINDMIRYGVPAFITATYPVEKGLRKMTFPYSSGEELFELILDNVSIVNTPKFQEQILQALKPWKKEKISEAFFAELEKILHDP